MAVAFSQPHRIARWTFAVPRLLALLGLLALLVLVGGCAGRQPVGNFETAPLPAFSDTGAVPQAQRWWTELDDPRLTARVEQSFGGNFDLAAALQQVSAARAVARRQASDFYPDVNGILNTRSDFGPGPDVFPSVLGLDAAWQIDLWGRIQASVDAERFRASATHADYQAVALTLASDVAQTWLALIESHAQLELLEEQIETNENGLKLQELRFGLGFIRIPDVLRQQQLLESTLEQRAIVQTELELREHQLAVLLGELPQAANYDPGTVLPSLPPLPATGLPAELLRRRPDVRRDYLAFVAADRDAAAAFSDQFPRLNLTGSVLNVADQPSDLFRDWFASVGSQLIAPLIDGGQRRAEVDRTAAITRLRFNQYGQTMLIAFREVEDALARERNQEERIKRLRTQVDLARRATDQLLEQYFIGEVEYLDVLTSLTALQRLQRETVSAELNLRLTRVSLYLALAGGFDPRLPPAAGGVVLIADDVVATGADPNIGNAEGEDIPAGESEADPNPEADADSTTQPLPAPESQLADPEFSFEELLQPAPPPTPRPRRLPP